MPISRQHFVFCNSCRKVLKVEMFGDALTPIDLGRMKNLKKKRLCGKCKVKNFFNHLLNSNKRNYKINIFILLPYLYF